MRIGQLDERISIYSTATVADGAGGFTKGADTLICTIWANVKPSIQTLSLEHGKVNQVNGYDITCRKLNIDLSRSYYIMRGSEKISIESVLVVDRYWQKITGRTEQ